MSQFLYFFPGLPRASVPRLEVLATFARDALWELLRTDKTWSGDAAVFNPLHQDGPGGHTGTIFACLPGGMITDESFSVEYRPGVQTWVQIDAAWLGWYKDNPPTEASLKRSKTVSGYAVELNDGESWMAPVIRCQPSSRVKLPHAVGLATGGVRLVKVKPQYQRWQDLAEKLWDHKFGRLQIRNGELWDAAAMLLSLNYQIGPREIDALGLFELIDEESEAHPNWGQIIDASYDWPLIQEMMDEAAKKKSQPEPSEQSVG